MSFNIKILYLENVTGSDAAVNDLLRRRGMDIEFLSVNNSVDFVHHLTGFAPHIILVYDGLSSSIVSDALRLQKYNHIYVPLIAIVAAGQVHPPAEIVNMMKQGAADYIFQEDLASLPQAITEALQTHGAEKITSRDFSLYSNNIDEIFFSIDAVTLKLIRISPGCENIIGYTTAEVLANPDLYIEALYPDDRYLIKDFGDKLKNGETVTGKLRVIHSDQAIHWLETKLVPTLDPKHRLVKIDGILRNITKAKDTEDELTHSEQRLRKLLENSGDMSMVINASASITYLSPNARRITGYEIHDLVSKKTLLENFHPGDLRAQMAIFKQSLKNPGETYSFEHRFKHANGNWLWVEGTYNNLLHLPAVNGVVVNFRDITSRKLTEQNLSHSERRYRRVVETAQEGIWISDTALKADFVNKKLCDILGYSAGEILGKHSYDFKPPEEKEKTLERVKTRGHGGAETHESVFITKTGERIICSVSGSDLLDEDGRSIGTLAMMTDITARRAEEEAHRRSEANLSAIIENTSDLVYSLDREFKFITYNQQFKNAAKAVYGFDVEQGGNVVEFLKKFDRELGLKWESIYTRTLQGETQQFVNEYDFNGGKIYLSYSVNPIRESGEVIGLSCFSRDITRQKADEVAIKSSAANLTAIIENTDSLVYSLDRDLRYVAFNQLFKDGLKTLFDLDIKPGDRTLDFLERSAPDKIPQWERIYRLALHGRRMQFTTDIETTAGKIFIYFSINPIWENRQVIGFSCSARDITRQKTDELAIKKSEASLRTIINNMDMSCILMDSRRNIVAFNGLAQIFSQEQNGITLKRGFPILEMVRPGRRDVILDIMERVKKGGSVNYENNREKDGIIKWYDMTWTGIKDHDQEDFGYIFTSRDITDKKNSEIEREKITADLIQRHKDMEQFTYIISHNLRAPVANIIGLSALLNEGDVEKGDLFELINGICHSAIKLDEVISDLNQVLQVSVSLNENIEPVSLSALIDNIKFSIKHLMEKENVQIDRDFKQGDQMRSLKSFLYSIFYNLILNSIKYRKPGVPPAISITTRVYEGKINIIYKDNGRGIDTVKYGNELFGFYKRFDTSVEGKGMGLFMVKKQVESLNGTISVQSIVDKGTQFILEFPQEFKIEG